MSQFVPTPGAYWTNLIGDRSALPVMRLYVDANDDDTAELDVTQHILAMSLKGGGKVSGAFGEAVSNEWNVDLDNVILGKESGDWANLLVVIKAGFNISSSDDLITIFTGYVKETGAKRKRTFLSDDAIQLEMYDDMRRALKAKMTGAVLAGFDIVDTGTPANSILHYLLLQAGIAAANVVSTDVSDSMVIVPVKEEASPIREVQQLTQGNLGMFKNRYDGKYYFESRFETGWSDPTSEWDLDGHVHTIEELGIVEIGNKIKTQFEEWELVPNDISSYKTIYRNTKNFVPETGFCQIEIAAGDYWPGPGANDKLRATYKDPKSGESFIAISVQTPTIGTTGSVDILASAVGLSIISFNGSTTATKQTESASELILRNTSGSTITIKRLRLRGTAYRKASVNFCEDIDPAITNSWDEVVLSINGKYITSPANGKEACEYWQEYNQTEPRKFKLEVNWIPQMQEGALVQWTPPGESQITLQVLEYEHHNNTRGARGLSTSLTLREWYTFSSAGTGIVVQQTTDNPGTGVQYEQFSTEPVGVVDTDTPENGSVQIYYGKKDSDDNVGFFIREYQDGVWERRLEMDLRTLGGAVDGYVSGYLEVGDALLSLPGQFWRSVDPREVERGVLMFSYSVAYDGTTIAKVGSAGGSNAYVNYSTDFGETWSLPIPITGMTSLEDVEWGNDIFITCELLGNELSRSANGQTWGAKIAVSGMGRLFSLATDGIGNWIVFGANAGITDYEVAFSDDDGLTWDTPVAPVWTGVGVARYARYGNGIWVAAVSDELAWATDPTGSWTIVANPLSGAIEDVRYADGVWLVVGQDSGGDGSSARSIDNLASFEGEINTNMLTGNTTYWVWFVDNLWLCSGEDNEISRSVDGGQSWMANTLTGAIPVIPLESGDIIWDMAYLADKKRIVSADPHGVWISETLVGGAGAQEAGPGYLSFHRDIRVLANGPAHELVVASDRTINKYEAGKIIMDPIDGDVDLTIPDPTTMKNQEIAFEMRHGAGGSRGLMIDGDCEGADSTNDPTVDTSPIYTSNGSIARSALVAAQGTYSKKVTLTTTGTDMKVAFADGYSTGDQHGFLDYRTYSLLGKLYVPSVGGCAVGEARFGWHYYSAAWREHYDRMQTLDAWIPRSSTIVVLNSVTGVVPIVGIQSTAASGEFMYVDDLYCFQHHSFNIIAPAGFTIENRTQFAVRGINARGVLYSDGEKWKIKEWDEQDIAHSSVSSASSISVNWTRKGRTLIMRSYGTPWSNGGYIWYPDNVDGICTFIRSSTLGSSSFSNRNSLTAHNTIAFGPHDAAGAYAHNRSNQYSDRFQMLDGSASNFMSWRVEGAWIGDV